MLCTCRVPRKVSALSSLVAARAHLLPGSGTTVNHIKKNTRSHVLHVRSKSISQLSLTCQSILSWTDKVCLIPTHIPRMAKSLSWNNISTATVVVAGRGAARWGGGNVFAVKYCGNLQIRADEETNKKENSPYIFSHNGLCSSEVESWGMFRAKLYYLRGFRKTKVLKTKFYSPN